LVLPAGSVLPNRRTVEDFGCEPARSTWTGPISTGLPSTWTGPISTGLLSTSMEPISTGLPSTLMGPISTGLPSTSMGPISTELPSNPMGPPATGLPSTGLPSTSMEPISTELPSNPTGPPGTFLRMAANAKPSLVGWPTGWPKPVAVCEWVPHASSVGWWWSFSIATSSKGEIVRWGRPSSKRMPWTWRSLAPGKRLLEPRPWVEPARYVERSPWSPAEASAPGHRASGSRWALPAQWAR
jgi:hypothetical protein